MKKAFYLFLLCLLLTSSLAINSGINVDTGDPIKIYIVKECLTKTILSSTPISLDSIEIISDYLCLENRMEVTEPYAPTPHRTSAAIQPVQQKKSFMTWVKTQKFMQFFKRKKK